MRGSLQGRRPVRPVYNDKHLSYSFEKAKMMVETSRRMCFRCWRIVAAGDLAAAGAGLPLGCEIEEALMVGEGGSDAMDFHALEGLQCMVERREGAARRR